MEDERSSSIPRLRQQPLPRLLMITGSDPNNPEKFLAKLQIHLQHGIQLVQLRASTLSTQAYIELAKQAVTLCHKAGARIILNTHTEIAAELGADGVHLTSQLLLQQKERPWLNDKIISAACHNLEQLQHAEKVNLDYVSLSPVQKTQTHADAIPLGWDNFGELCQSVALPVYGLGGLTEHDLSKVLAAGGYGVAAITALWDRVYSN